MKLGKAVPSDRSAMCVIAQSLIAALTRPVNVLVANPMEIRVSQSAFELDQSKAPVQSVAVVVRRKPRSWRSKPSVR